MLTAYISKPNYSHNCLQCTGACFWKCELAMNYRLVWIGFIVLGWIYIHSVICSVFRSLIVTQTFHFHVTLFLQCIILHDWNTLLPPPPKANNQSEEMQNLCFQEWRPFGGWRWRISQHSLSWTTKAMISSRSGKWSSLPLCHDELMNDWIWCVPVLESCLLEGSFGFKHLLYLSVTP